MANPYKIEAGQYMVWEPAEGAAKQVCVMSVGRLWTHLDNGHKISNETLEAEFTGYGHSVPGRCWLTRAHYEENSERMKTIMDMRLALNRAKNLEHLTVPELKEMLKKINGCD